MVETQGISDFNLPALGGPLRGLLAGSLFGLWRYVDQPLQGFVKRDRLVVTWLWGSVQPTCPR